MSRNVNSYEWRMKVNQPIRHPWQAYDVIRFRDPNCSSTDPRFKSSSKKTSGTNPPRDGPPPPPPAYPSASQGPSAPTEAPSYTTSTPQSKANIDVRVMIDGGRIWGMSVHCKTFYEDLLRRSERETHRTLKDF
jgi:hypothetical protein